MEVFLKERVERMTESTLRAQEMKVSSDAFMDVLWERIQKISPTLMRENLDETHCNGLVFVVSAPWRSRESGHLQHGSGLLPARYARRLAPAELMDPSIPGVTSKHLRLRPTSHPLFDQGKFTARACLVIPLKRIVWNKFELHKVY